MNLYDLFRNTTPQFLTETDFTLEMIFLFMFISLCFSLYIFLIYRFSSRSNFYSPSFGKTLVGMSVVTTSIIIAMQGSLIVSLGMVGALSIVRFRNAVKAPLDLLFLFWSISTGIICGTGIFKIAIVTSIIMTIVILGMDFIPIGRSSYILTINGTDSLDETTLLESIKPFGKHIKIRSRNAYSDQLELLLELYTKEGKELVTASKQVPGVTSVSLIFHDGEVRF